MPLTRPWFKFYVSDWLSSSTIFLMSPYGRSAYIQLLAQQWNCNNQLPDDDEQLFRLSLLTREQWEIARKEILPLFEKVGDKLVNLKLAGLWEKSENEAKAKSEAGKRGRLLQLSGLAQGEPGESPGLAQAEPGQELGDSPGMLDVRCEDKDKDGASGEASLSDIKPSRSDIKAAIENPPAYIDPNNKAIPIAVLMDGDLQMVTFPQFFAEA